MEPGQEPEPGGGWFHFNPLDIEDIAGPVLPERRRGEDDVAERANGHSCRSCGTLSWVTRPLRDGWNRSWICIRNPTIRIVPSCAWTSSRCSWSRKPARRWRPRRNVLRRVDYSTCALATVPRRCRTCRWPRIRSSWRSGRPDQPQLFVEGDVQSWSLRERESSLWKGFAGVGVQVGRPSNPAPAPGRRRRQCKVHSC